MSSEITFLGTISSPTVYSPEVIFIFSFSLSSLFVSGTGMLISPPCPIFFFRLTLNLFGNSLGLKRWIFTPWFTSHSWTISPPFLAISPLLLVTWYRRATSDQLIFSPSFLLSTSFFSASLSLPLCQNFQSDFSSAFSLIFLPRFHNSVFFLQPPQIQRMMQAFPVALQQRTVVLPNICSNDKKIYFWVLFAGGGRWFSLELHDCKWIGMFSSESKVKPNFLEEREM